MIDINRQAELRQAIEQFYFAYRAFTGRADAVLAQRGLGRVHHRILYFVGRNSGTSVNQLLGILGVSRQALNVPLRQLIDARLIAVETPEQDRRMKLLTLTAAGEKLEGQLTSMQMQHLQSAFTAAGTRAEAGWGSVMAAMAISELHQP